MFNVEGASAELTGLSLAMSAGSSGELGTAYAELSLTVTGDDPVTISPADWTLSTASGTVGDPLLSSGFQGTVDPGDSVTGTVAFDGVQDGRVLHYADQRGNRASFPLAYTASPEFSEVERRQIGPVVTSLGQPRDRDGETGVVIRLCAADDAELTLRRSAVSFRTADGESLAVGEGTPDGGRSWTDEPGADIVLLPDSVFLAMATASPVWSSLRPSRRSPAWWSRSTAPRAASTSRAGDRQPSGVPWWKTCRHWP